MDLDDSFYHIDNYHIGCFDSIVDIVGMMFVVLVVVGSVFSIVRFG